MTRGALIHAGRVVAIDAPAALAQRLHGVRVRFVALTGSGAEMHDPIGGVICRR